MCIALDSTDRFLVLSGFGRPFGLHVDLAGRLLVTDMDLHRVFRLSPDLREVQWIGGQGGGWTAAIPVISGMAARHAPQSPERFHGPHSVVEMDDGSLAILTYYTPGVHIAAGDGTAAGKFGSDLLKGPATITQTYDGRLLITEYALHGVCLFAVSGTFLGGLGGGSPGFGPQWSFPPGTAPGAFDRPHMCRQLPDGDLVVADTWNHRLQLFTVDGTWVAWLGSGISGWNSKPGVPSERNRAGAFRAPVSVAALSDGGIIVTDWGNNRVQWFDASGGLVRVLDNLGLDRPYDAIVAGNRMIVADSHNGRVLLLEV